MKIVAESMCRNITRKVITQYFEKIYDVHLLICETLHRWDINPNLLLGRVFVDRVSLLS